MHEALLSTTLTDKYLIALIKSHLLLLSDGKYTITNEGIHVSDILTEFNSYIKKRDKIDSN